MIPIQDVIPSRARPWATLALVAGMTMVMLTTALAPPETIRGVVHAFGWTGPRAWALFPLTALFHASLLQGAGNLLVLWIFGDTLEDRLGHTRVALVYLAGAAGSWAVVVAIHPASAMPGIGPAGAVAAIVGAYLMQLPRSRVFVLVALPFLLDLIEIPAAIVPAFWVLLQIVGIGHWGGGVTAAGQLLWAVTSGLAIGALAGRFMPGRPMDWERPRAA
jgi:membrane associated rhomboid family serine protease